MTTPDQHQDTPPQNRPQSRPQNMGAFTPEAQAEDTCTKPSFYAYFIKRPIVGAFSLLTGMGITLKTLCNVTSTVTQEYPENRDTLTMPPAFRGQVIMPHDEEGEHKCTACTLCEKACPNGTISVLPMKNIANKKVLGKYIYRFDQCTLCSLCVEACPFDAIRMGNDFEHATVDKDSLVMVLNEKEGRL